MTPSLAKASNIRKVSGDLVSAREPLFTCEMCGGTSNARNTVSVFFYTLGIESVNNVDTESMQPIAQWCLPCAQDSINRIKNAKQRHSRKSLEHR